MAFNFSRHSLEQLKTLHPLLQEGLKTLIVTDDFKVDQGGRTEAEQWEFYWSERSTLHPPEGKHLIQPDGWAYAADIWPYVGGKRLVVPTYEEVVQADKAGVVEAIGHYAQFAWMMRRAYEVMQGLCHAHRLQTGEKFRARLGINWDGDSEILTDQSFDDFPHIELVRY